jgi:broad specificity phosphatase PhoE
MKKSQTHMNICIIRHGQSNYNVLGLCNDDPQANVYLTEQGIAQAHAAAQALSGHAFDVIYISQLLRARQTADIINETHHVSMLERSELNDIRSGFEGQPVERYFAAVGHDRMNTVPPGGESLRQYQQRVNGFIDELVRQPYRKVLVVAHEETLRVFAARFQGLSDDALQALSFANCEYECFKVGSPGR